MYPHFCLSFLYLTLSASLSGYACLPLRNVLYAGTMNGNVLIKSPDMIVGYDEQVNSSTVGRAVVESRQDLQLGSTKTMLKIHATTDPFTVVPRQLFPEFPSNEPTHIVARVEQWPQRYHMFNDASPDELSAVQWPHRGHLVLASRFLTPQVTPPGFDTLSSCAHYVSLLSDGHSERSMLLSSQQVININEGLCTEKAILLANFFLHLNKKKFSEAEIFLGVGLSMPEGNTVSESGFSCLCLDIFTLTFWSSNEYC